MKKTKLTKRDAAAMLTRLMENDLNTKALDRVIELFRKEELLEDAAARFLRQLNNMPCVEDLPAHQNPVLQALLPWVFDGVAPPRKIRSFRVSLACGHDQLYDLEQWLDNMTASETTPLLAWRSDGADHMTIEDAAGFYGVESSRFAPKNPLGASRFIVDIIDQRPDVMERHVLIVLAESPAAAHKLAKDSFIEMVPGISGEFLATQVVARIDSDATFTRLAPDGEDMETLDVIRQAPSFDADVDNVEHAWESEDLDYPVDAWAFEVQNNATRLGYADWVAHQKELDSTDT